MGIETERETDREEIYERIPWQTFEQEPTNKQWLPYAIAGAIVLGAFAYTFVRGQPGVTAVSPTPPVAEAPAGSSPGIAVPIPPSAPLPTSPTPIVAAEADLFAVDPVRLADQATAWAEWFAIEYVGADGSSESANALSSLLPEGVPPPEVPEGTQVFVDWVGALDTERQSDGSFAVTVLVRTLLNSGDGLFVRQPPTALVVPVGFGTEGLPQVSRPPSVVNFATGLPASLEVSPASEELAATVPENVELVLGEVTDFDGAMAAVVMRRSSDGVLRPETVTLGQPEN